MINSLDLSEISGGLDALLDANLDLYNILFEVFEWIIILLKFQKSTKVTQYRSLCLNVKWWLNEIQLDINTSC